MRCTPHNQARNTLRTDYHRALKAAVDEDVPEANVPNPPSFVLTIRQMRELCQKQDSAPAATLSWVSRSVEYIFQMINYTANVTCTLEELLKKFGHLKSHEMYLKYLEKTINLSRIVLSQAKFVDESLEKVKRMVLRKLDQSSGETVGIWKYFFGFASAVMVDPQKFDIRLRDLMEANKLLICMDEQFEYDPDWMYSKDRDSFKVLMVAKTKYFTGETCYAELASPHDEFYRKHMHLFTLDAPEQTVGSKPNTQIFPAADAKTHEAIDDAMIIEDDSSMIPANPGSTDNILVEKDNDSTTGQPRLVPEGEHAILVENQQPAEVTDKSMTIGTENEAEQAEGEPIVGRKVLPQFFTRDTPACQEVMVNCDGLPIHDLNLLMASLVFDKISYNFKTNIIPGLELRINQMRNLLEQQIKHPSRVKEQMISFLMDPWRTAAEDWSSNQPRGWVTQAAVSVGVLALCYMLVLDVVSPVVGNSPLMIMKYIDKQENILAAALIRFLLSHLTWSAIGFLIGENPISAVLLQSKFNLSMLKRTIHYLLLTEAFRWMFSGMSLSLFIVQTWIVELLVVPDQLAWQVIAQMRAVGLFHMQMKVAVVSKCHSIESKELEEDIVQKTDALRDTFKKSAAISVYVSINLAVISYMYLGLTCFIEIVAAC